MDYGVDLFATQVNFTIILRYENLSCRGGLDSKKHTVVSPPDVYITVEICIKNNNVYAVYAVDKITNNYFTGTVKEIT